MKEWIAIALTSLFVGKTLTAMRNLRLSQAYLKRSKNRAEQVILTGVKMLILIPVIREQNVIGKTLDHFRQMQSDDLDVTLCVVGTAKESAEKAKQLKRLRLRYYAFQSTASLAEAQKSLRGLFTEETAARILANKASLTYDQFEEDYKKEASTADVVEAWIENNEDQGKGYVYVETPAAQGDRATQLNYALKEMTGQGDFDIVGVYDADSLPDADTFYQVAAVMSQTECDACQQPLHFQSSIALFEKERMHPILSASALFQTTWSMIKELPALIHYSRKDPAANQRCLYMNGHGEFFRTTSLEKMGGFPSNVVTDGVQIGYRLSMSQKNIQPIPSFCNDEMTDDMGQIMIQHSRWYAGCMRVRDAYDWALAHGGKPKFIQLLDGHHMNAAWAYSPLYVFLTFLFVFWPSAAEGGGLLQLFFGVTFLAYNYLLPYWAVRHVLQFKGKIRLSTWLCMPLACVLKSIGPQIYFFQAGKRKLFGREIAYKKVER